MWRAAVADYPAGASLATRVIEDFELVWMVRGRATFVTEESTLTLRPGLLLLVPPGLRHGFDWDRARPCRHGYVHFAPEDVGVDLPAEVTARRMTTHDPLAGLCAHLLWLGRRPAGGWADAARDTLRFLLRLLIDGPGVSRGHFSRLFRAEVGIGIATGLERLRCSRAEILLTRTDLPVGSVATECGFADLFHFSHRFARVYGMSPTAYRDAGGSDMSVLDHPGVRTLAVSVWESGT